MRAFGGIFVATMVLYVTLYGGCAASRGRGGPRGVFSGKTADGAPPRRVDKPKLLPAGTGPRTFPRGQEPTPFTHG